MPFSHFSVSYKLIYKVFSSIFKIPLPMLKCLEDFMPLDELIIEWQ